MQSERHVGVLLSTPVLRRIVRQQPTFESAILYVKAAKRLNLKTVLFSLRGYNPYRRTVRGYVWQNGTWTIWTGSLPLVVHNRILTKTLRSVRRLRLLRSQLGHSLFNPFVSRDKWYIWQRLAGNKQIRDHLPQTWPLSLRLCRHLPNLIERYGSIVIKPRVGGLGLGILFIEPVFGQSELYRLVPTNGRTRVVGIGPLIHLMRRLRVRRPYMVQDAIPLVKYRSRRCDMRVPVQRDGRGRWRVMTATIKRATRHRYLTNIARGGKAYAADSVLKEIFGEERGLDIRADIQRLALAVAHRLSERCPQLADLGLDIGIDAAGKPWLIEVNFRDQRLPSERAHQYDAHAQLYHNPMAYAHYLLSQRIDGSTVTSHRRADS